MKKTKKTEQTATVQEVLGLDPSMSDRDVAIRLYTQVTWLAGELARRGAKPEDVFCQHVPEGKCANCAGDLPWCWVEASGFAVGKNECGGCTGDRPDCWIKAAYADAQTAKEA